MRCAWVSGWAIPPAYVERMARERFPSYAHTVTYPGKSWESCLVSNADIYIGHSLGAFLLMRHVEQIPSDAVLALLAPFSDFRAESAKGGCVNTTQLRLLLRMLKLKPVDALNDFYTRAGLPHRCEGHLPYGRADLIWGIEQLLETSVSEDAYQRTRLVLMGDADALLSAQITKTFCPQLNIISGAGHALKDLLPHLKC